MKSDSDDHHGKGDDGGYSNNGTERTSKTSGTNRTKSHAGRSASSHGSSRSNMKLTTRSGKTTEPIQRHLSHSGRVKVTRPSVSSQAVPHTGTPVKNVQVHLTKLTLSPESKSGRKLSAKKYLDKVRQEQQHARARRSRKTSPARSPEQVTLTGSGPSPRTKTIIEKLVAQRPRRTVTPKNLDYSAGLSWQEEKELKRALYVSLQESRRSSASQSRTESPMPDSGSEEHKPMGNSGRRGRKPAAALGINPMISPHTGNSGQSTPDTLKEGNGNSMSSVVDSVSSQTSSQCKLLKAQVRAQRKFAQGSRPVSPCLTPRKPKSVSTPKKQPLPSVMAKTEDFLTFLCLRGSSVLPPNLEFFNYTDSDSHMSFPNTPRHSQDGSQPATPLSGGDTPRNGKVGGGTPRGRSPAPQSRASSPDHEIVALGEELGVSPLVTIATASPLVAGSSATTASSSSVRFTHVASSPTNIECATVAELPLQPLQRCPSLACGCEGVADVESSLNEHFPLKIDSDWRTICEFDTGDIDGTVAESSTEKLGSELNEANIEECSVETSELGGSEVECSWKMEIATQTLGGDSCDVDERQEPDSAAVINEMPNLVVSEPWKTDDVCSLQKVAPPVIATIVDSSQVPDIGSETSVSEHDNCAINVPSEFISNISDAVGGAVPMATCISTCAPLLSTYRSDFGVSLALLPSLQLISTTSLLSNVTVVLVGGDHGVTYTAPALLAPQSCDVTQHSDWPVLLSDSDGATHNATVSGDTFSQCCHVLLTTSVWSRPLTSCIAASQHVDCCVSPPVSTSMLSSPLSSDVSQVASVSHVTPLLQVASVSHVTPLLQVASVSHVAPLSQVASVSQVLTENMSAFESCLRSLSITNSCVPPAGRDVVATHCDPDSALSLPGRDRVLPHCDPAPSPQVGVVCSSVVSSCTSRPSLTITVRLPVPFTADASGCLTVLPSRVRSLMRRDHVPESEGKQGEGQVARTRYDLRRKHEDCADTGEEEALLDSSVEYFQLLPGHGLKCNDTVCLSMDCNYKAVGNDVASCAEEKRETLADRGHFSSVSAVKCSQGSQSCDIEYNTDHVDVCVECIHSSVGYNAASLSKQKHDTSVGCGSFSPVSPGREPSLYSAVPFPQTACVVVNSLILPRVVSWSTSRSRPCHRNPKNIRGSSNIIPGHSNIIPGPSNIIPGSSNIIPEPSNIILGHSDIFCGLSDIIPGPGNIIPGLSNTIPGPSDILPGVMDYGYPAGITNSSTRSCSFTPPGGTIHHNYPPDRLNVSPCVSMHHCAALDPNLCSEGWRHAHDIPLEVGHRYEQPLALFPPPPVIMAPGVFRFLKPCDDTAAGMARKRFHVVSSLKSARLKPHLAQRSLSMAKHSTLGRAMAHHVRKTATTRLSNIRPLLGGEGRVQGGGDTGGLSWHEKLLMRRARNAAASRNRRRLKKLGVLTRSKRRTLETQARTTENEAAAAALQAGPVVPPPLTKHQAVSGNVARRSEVMVRRRPASRRVLADVEIDSEPPYVAVVKVGDRGMDVRSSKPTTSDQRIARRQHHHNSPGGSITDERTTHHRTKLSRRKESHVDPVGKGGIHRRDTQREGDSSTIATKTRSRSSSHTSERPIKQHYSRDVTSTRDSRAKRRSTTSVDQEEKVASRKDSQLSRTDDNVPSRSGGGQKATEGGSPSERNRKKSRGHLPASPPYKTVFPQVAFRQPFPASQYPPCIVAAPVYHPGIEQFQEPISYIESVRGDAESYGMCVIVPPEGWQPECNISEDLRFTTQVQHVHKMQNRWGPNVVHLECIKKHLESQGRKVEQHPLVGGIELDIPTLHNTIVKFGGLQQVIDKCKWPRVADSLNIPKSALERTTRLYDAYCKYLLSYDMLSEEDKAKLRQHVLTMAGKKSHIQQQDCFTKGKSRTLGEFFRIARNTAAMWFANEQPTTEQVEAKYWSLVSDASLHVSVQTAHVDTSSCGSAFPSRKDSPYYRHGWNFKELQHNSSSFLQYIGQVADVSVPTLHINMLFSTGCLSRDLHLLPYIHYLHSGDDIIWYCVPSSEEDKLQEVVKKLCPALVDTSDPVWLSDDTIMLSPELLKQHGLSVCRCVQKQGQYVVIFPGAFTAWVSCGYNIAESLRFATPSWIPLGKKAAKMLMESCEPDLFSLDRLLLTVARIHKLPADVLRQTLPHLRQTVNTELSLRKQLVSAGLKASERLPDDFSLTSGRQRRSFELSDLDENRCEVCKRTCYLSMVVNETEDTVYCLPHALTHIEKKRNLRVSRLLYRFTEVDLTGIIEQARHRLVASSPTKNRSPKMKT